MPGQRFRHNDQHIWHLYQTLPRGGPLLTEFTNKPFRSKRTRGQGTIQDPAVHWSSNTQPLIELAPLNDKHFYLRETEEFAIREVQKLGKDITHIWIRMHVHSQARTRTEFTNLPTGEVEDADPHITVYLGTARDHINLHGHFYVSWPEPPNDDTKEEDLDRLREEALKTTPYELMHPSDRRRTPSQMNLARWQARNPELWIWVPKRVKPQPSRVERIKEEEVWE